MGSPCEVLVETRSDDTARALTELVANEAWRIEDKFSRYLEGNIVDRINSAGGQPVAVDDETGRLIDFAAMLFDTSDGKFDITSGVLRRAWTFDGGKRVPAAAEVQRLLRRVGWGQARWHDNFLTLPPGMEIDFGGIGKEYAVDQAVMRLRRSDAPPALVNFGGDLAVTAAPAGRPAWIVGLESLHGPGGSPARIIRLASGALATSGDTRRYVMHDGVRYGHILDPHTGWPVPDAPSAITVAADSCVQAGVFCTLAMLEGAKAEEFLTAEGVDHWVTRL
jgi:thiamine biosynthesis lipoprotein